MRSIRGNEIGMIFQDPLTSLNPTMTIGKQIAEVVSLHREVSKEQAMDRAAEVLDLVGIPRVRERIKEYPHQFSGGMRQRVMIAMALACEPKLLIADEPTTALDVTIQKQILELIDDLRLRLGMSVILVTHDLGVIAGRADRVAVMYAGQIAELTDTETLFARPRHPYTEALFQSLPDKAAEAGERLYSIPGLPPDLVNPPTGCRFAARCRYVTDRCREEEPSLTAEVVGHSSAASTPSGRRSAARPADVVDYNQSALEAPVEGPGIGDVLLDVEHLVKDYPVTKGAVLQRRVGLAQRSRGRELHDPQRRDVRPGRRVRLREEHHRQAGRRPGEADRRRDQLRGQGPGEEHRPGVPEGTQEHSAHVPGLLRLPRPAECGPGRCCASRSSFRASAPRRSSSTRVGDMLDKVGLPRSAADRYPHEFSGGQRQRLGFARALMLNPQLIVADEPVSALDVSIQAQVLNMMKELQHDLGLTYLFISHDLGVVRYLSEKIGVMYLGKLVEVGPAEEVYLRPAHPYTRGLLDSAPVADPAAEKAKVSEGVTGELPSAIHPPSGCRFRTRCPRAQAICADVEPPMPPFAGEGHLAACHFPLEIAVGAPVDGRGAVHAELAVARRPAEPRSRTAARASSPRGCPLRLPEPGCSAGVAPREALVTASPQFTTRPQLAGTFGMVASTHWLASAAGMAVLERGGNAFDAAVAAGLVLQVVEPHLNGPAGEVPVIGFDAAAGQPFVLDGQGTAPAAATLEAFAAPRPRPRAGHRPAGCLRASGVRYLDAAAGAVRHAAAARGHGVRDRLRRARLPDAAGRERRDRGGRRHVPGPLARLGRDLPGRRSPGSWQPVHQPPAGRRLRAHPGRGRASRRPGASARSRRPGTPSTRVSSPTPSPAYLESAEVMDVTGRRNRGLLTADDLAGWRASAEAPVTRRVPRPDRLQDRAVGSGSCLPPAAWAAGRAWHRGRRGGQR